MLDIEIIFLVSHLRDIYTEELFNLVCIILIKIVDLLRIFFLNYLFWFLFLYDLLLYLWLLNDRGWLLFELSNSNPLRIASFYHGFLRRVLNNSLLYKITYFFIGGSGIVEEERSPLPFQ